MAPLSCAIHNVCPHLNGINKQALNVSHYQTDHSFLFSEEHPTEQVTFLGKLAI